VRWTYAAVLTGCLVALGLVGCKQFVDHYLRSDFGGDFDRQVIEVPVGHAPNEAWLFVPGSKLRPDEVRKRASEACATQGVEILSAALGTRQTPEAIASGYAARMGRDVRAAIYEGCLGRTQGLTIAVSRELAGLAPQGGTDKEAGTYLGYSPSVLSRRSRPPDPRSRPRTANCRSHRRRPVPCHTGGTPLRDSTTYTTRATTEPCGFPLGA
jgi:hypothetical protein